MKKSIFLYLIIFVHICAFSEQYTFGPNQLSVEVPKNFKISTLGTKDDGVDRFSAYSEDGLYLGINGSGKKEYFVYSIYKKTTSDEIKEGATKEVYKTWTTTSRKLLINNIEQYSLTAVKETKKLIVVVAYMSKVKKYSSKKTKAQFKKILDSITIP